MLKNTISDSRLKYIVALANNPAIGAKTIFKLEKFFGSLSNLWRAGTIDELEKINLASNIKKQVMLVIKSTSPDNELTKVRKQGIEVVSFYCPGYPKMLKEIPDPPVILYLKGNTDIADNLAVAVVGARKYSFYGRKVTEDIVFKLARTGITIVSGLALGIDALAHRATLDAQGKTIGVLGCGVDQIYPTSNDALARNMIDAGGTIMSEYPPGTPPYKSNFPLRNRIISGLSVGVLVIEAAEKSGTLLTAKAALDYNRQLFAIPNSIYAPTSIGANNLIKYGAKLVNDVKDITEELNVETKTQEITSRKFFPQSKEEAIICEHLHKDKAVNIDKLAKLTKLDIASCNAKLTFLEIKGIVRNIGASNYILRE